MKSAIASTLSLFLAAFLLAPAARGQDASFQRADANADGAFDLTDVVAVLEALFLTSDPLDCQDVVDANDDGRLNISDPILVVRHLLQGGEPPAPPFGECGVDPTPDDRLSCTAYSPCEGGGDICLSEELLGEALGEIPGFEFCLPSGLLDLEVEGLAISVCPAEGAMECGLAGGQGCPVELTGIEPFVDLEAGTVGLHLEGRIEDLPIDITAAIGGTTTCLNDFRGSEADSPFSFDLIVPLVTEEVEPGAFEIVGTGAGMVDNVDLQLESTGGIVCVLFQAGQGAFIDLLIGPLAAIVESVAAPLNDAVVGLRLCPEGADG